MTDDLRAQVARIKAGDKVTATYRVAADVWSVSGIAKGDGSIWIAGTRADVLRHGDGTPGSTLVSIDSHEPALPPEPPVGSVAKVDGLWWQRWPSGWWSPRHEARYIEWSDLALRADEVFTPGGEA